MPSGNRSKTNKTIRKYIIKRLGKLSDGARINIPELQRNIQTIDRRIGIAPRRIASLLKDEDAHYSKGEWYKGGSSS